MNYFTQLDTEKKYQIENLVSTIEKVFPIPRRYALALPRSIAELSHLLTNNRSERQGGYMGKPAMLHAYLSFFLPWNVFRLCRLLPSLINETVMRRFFYEGAVIVDAGCGPLTFAVSLWISFPQMRGVKLIFYCIDSNSSALDAGKKLFHAITGGNTSWRITTIRATLGERIKLPKASFLTAINVFNEIIQNIPQADTTALSKTADKFTSILSHMILDDGAMLIVEPGVPQSGQFLSMLRSAFMENGLVINAPCPHNEALCAMSGGRRGAKWCHFVFDTHNAPPLLQKLSASCGLYKEDAALSFLFAARNKAHDNKHDNNSEAGIVAVKLCVLSGSFLIGPAHARYACCKKGLAVIRGGKTAVENLPAGTVICLPPPGKCVHDKKTKAIIFDLGESGGARVTF
ncbi:hypothetical protein FACS1894190_09210 [Spirochaetia bacterium]|nr:hypothetical protein FACS1894190_09210 [Spirochaetia bacterium]